LSNRHANLAVFKCALTIHNSLNMWTRSEQPLTHTRQTRYAVHCLTKGRIMTYTIRTARMTLATAQGVMATLDQGWDTDQIARAKAVLAHWARIRKNQAKKVTA
jgi:hypothetical protein